MHPKNFRAPWRVHRVLGACLVAFFAGLAAAYFALMDDAGKTVNEPEPLYWVAPMDPNYRRDEPGKSPMGMDLVPVYEDTAAAGDASPGSFHISPDVVNNLGVRTALVKTGKLRSEINTVGYLQYNQSQLVHINPRIAGWIEKLYVNTSGDRVSQGQPLYALYSPELVSAQQEFLQALAAGSPRFIAAAEDRLRVWRVSEDFIEQLREARTVQQTIKYFAPQDGFVTELNVRPGQFVQPNTLLMSLAQLDNIWVEAEVFASQAHLVEVGLPVTMRLSYLPRKIWRGRVDYVYPSIDAKTRTLGVRLTFSNEDGQLKPNMFADIAIHGESDSESTLVPDEAVIRTGETDRVVLALGDGRFKSVAVTLGRTDGDYIEILEGVKVGEKVVISAQFLLDSESSKTSGFVRMHDSGDYDDPGVNRNLETPQ